jgi:hypothetical protein
VVGVVLLERRLHAADVRDALLVASSGQIVGDARHHRTREDRENRDRDDDLDQRESSAGTGSMHGSAARGNARTIPRYRRVQSGSEEQAPDRDELEICSVDRRERAHRRCVCFHRRRSDRALDVARDFRRHDRYPGPPFTMEHWSIELEKESFKFSAAHFLIFPDGSAERLHGHNYRVFVEIDAALDALRARHGLQERQARRARVVR